MFVPSVSGTSVLDLLASRKEAGADPSISFLDLEQKLKGDFPKISPGVFRTDLEFALRRLKEKDLVGIFIEGPVETWNVWRRVLTPLSA